ncbi:MAG: VWA-like domain-containing protein [Treponema sp.]|nr:VWA-like domain-containing protein [Treponema sp.]
MANENLLEKQFSLISKSWFLNEPLLFSVLTTHSLVQNPNLSVPFRTGNFIIEYSPKIIQNYTQPQLESALKFELYRILLGHPYARQPHNAKKGALFLASDIIISQFFKPLSSSDLPEEPSGIAYLKFHAARIKNLEYPLGKKWADTEELAFFQRNLQLDRKTGDLIFQDDLTFEQWYKKIVFLIEETSAAGTQNAGNGNSQALIPELAEESAELWEENEDAQKNLQSQIQKAEAEQGWGGIGGNLELHIKESCDFSFDYRRALTKFRAKIVSAERYLTRMRPSRRYGFSAMGSRYRRRANLLVAVDVSGSITEESFSHFYKAITNFFFLGMIQKIDLIFFDVNLKNTKPVLFSKSINLSQINARGGTNFQPAIDFFAEHKSDYSGMIIFTDGEGAPPKVQFSPDILWILDSRLSYEKSRYWINSLPGSCSTYLPF